MPRRKSLKYQLAGEHQLIVQTDLLLGEAQLKINNPAKLQEFTSRPNLVAELGCGYGEYSLEMAQLQPDKNFLAVDLKGDRLWTGAEIARKSGLDNILFLRAPIHLLENIVPSSCLQQIWLTFPDPQPNKPKKRLTWSGFLEFYSQWLTTSGSLHLKTDSQLLFEDALKNIQLQNKFEVKLKSRDLVNEEWYLQDPILQIQTRFQKKASGTTIKYLEAKKIN